MTTPDITIDPSALPPEGNKPQTTNEPQKPAATSENSSSTNTVVTNTESVSQRLNALISLVRDRLKLGLDQTPQDELAALLTLIPEVDNSYYAQFTPLIEIAIQSLLSEKPDLPLAKGIRKGIEENVHRSPLATIIRGGSPPARVIRGLGTLVAVFPLVALAAMFLRLIPGFLAAYEVILGPVDNLVWLVAIAGAIGSVVSIMVRVQDYEPLTNSDPTILFLIGFFKPIVGIAFALFVYATLNSGLIPLTVNSAQAPYFYTALAFVSGFSERFAKDIITQTEDKFAPVQTTSG